MRKASVKLKSSRLKGGLANTMFPMAAFLSNRIVIVALPLLCRRQAGTLIGGVRYDRQQNMRRPLRVPINLVRHGLVTADVVRDVLHVGHRASAGRNIHGCDVEADPVTGLELICGRENLYSVLDHFPRIDESDCVPRELVEWLPGL